MTHAWGLFGALSLLALTSIHCVAGGDDLEPIGEAGAAASVCGSSLGVYSRSMGGAGFLEGYTRDGASLEVDAWGNALIGGDFKGTLDLGEVTHTSAGSSDAFLAKVDERGRLLWSRRFGDGEQQIFSDLAVTRDGGAVITGVFSGTIDLGGGPLTAQSLAIFLARLDASGRHLWSRSFGGGDTIQWADAVTTDDDGNVILFGNLEGTLDFGGVVVQSGGVFPILVKFDERGRPLWGKAFGGSVDQIPIDVATDRRGNIYITEEAKASVIDGLRLRGDAFYNTLVARFSPRGDLHWAKIFRESGAPAPAGHPDTYPTAMAVDSHGNLVVAGAFTGEIDFGSGPISTRDPDGYAAYLVSFDPQGNATWSRVVEGTDINSITLDRAGGLVIGGAFERSVDFGGGLLVSAGGSDAFVARLLPRDGWTQWVWRFGDGADQRVTGVAAGRGGRVLLTGVYDGSLNFGCGPIRSVSGKDLFLAAIRP